MELNKIMPSIAATGLTNDQDNSDNNIFDKLTKEDIFDIIAILPKRKLNEPIQNLTKEYSKYHPGFNPPLTMEKLQEVYYKAICKNKDLYLRKYTETILAGFTNKIKEEIDISNISFDKIMVGEEESFKKLISILLDGSFCEHVFLYFKLNEIELSERQIHYINDKVHIKKEIDNSVLQLKTELNNLRIKHIRDIEDLHKKEVLTITQTLNQRDELLKEKDKTITLLEKSLEIEMKRNTSISQKSEINELENRNLKQEILIKNKDIKSLNKTIDDIKIELGELKNTKYIISKADMNSLTKQLIRQLDNDELRGKFFTFIQRERILNELIEKDHELRSVLYDEANKKWEQENQLRLKKSEELDIQLQELKNNLEFLTYQINEKEAKKAETVTTLENLQNKVQNFVDTLDEEIYNHLFNKAVLKPFLKTEKASQVIPTTKQNAYIKISIQSKDIPTIEIEQFAENLADNFENIGISNEISYNMSCLFIGCISSGLVPLIYGNKTRNVANAISAAYAGCTPHLVTLPIGFADANEIIDQYLLSSANVVLFEDAVGGMNENSLLPLLREWTSKGTERLDKLLLISSENDDSIKYMPNNLLNYCVVINTDEFEGVNNGDLNNSNAIVSLSRWIENCNTDKKYLGKISTLTENAGLSKLYNLQRADIISYMCDFLELDCSIALTTIAKIELLPIVKSRKALSNFANNLKSLELDPKFKTLIDEELANDQYSN